MQSSFLEYLGGYDSPYDIIEESLLDFTENLTNFETYVKEEERDPITNLLDITRKLRDLGAPMEAHKIMKANAGYNKTHGDENQYWRDMYYAGAFANLGFPTESIEIEARIICELLRNEGERLRPFLPLFLNNYAGILHLYREDLHVANRIYREAIECINEIDEEKFFNTVGKEYLWAHKLIINNYIDSLFVTDRNEEEDNELNRMMHLVGKDLERTESEYIKALTLINEAELNARDKRGDRAKEILEEVSAGISDNIRRLIEPSFYRIKAMIFVCEGKKKESIDYLIKAIEEAGYYGNTLSETLTMRDGLKIYQLLSVEMSRGERLKLFRDEGLLSYFLRVLKVKDRYLGSEHIRVVKDTAVGIAEKLKLNTERINLIKYAAQMHDIGKYVIPWYSLNKLSPLDRLDWEILRAHPMEGARILRKLGLDDIASIVLNHHERIDGSGYPNHIRDINLETEIVAISDAYNAAISPNRKYKMPKSSDRVLAEIERGECGTFSREVISGLKKYIKN